MIDEERIRRMAVLLQMNPETARKILLQAGTVPEILKRCRKYERGDTDGQEHTGAVHRCL